MELESLRKYLTNRKGISEEIPFGPEALVFKVLGKMFAILAWQESPLKISLKCDPEHALALRDIYAAVQPGYHLHKKHWNTVTLDGSVPEGEIRQWIDESYRLVVKGLKKADREKLGSLEFSEKEKS
ncbi:MAG: MmcQ/YjbR family DNA-binding protein [bacterium]|nr:MmcQ/YjbR family DNA-binding protein [bacterium]